MRNMIYMYDANYFRPKHYLVPHGSVTFCHIEEKNILIVSDIVLTSNIS